MFSQSPSIQRQLRRYQQPYWAPITDTNDLHKRDFGFNFRLFRLQPIYLNSYCNLSYLIRDSNVWIFFLLFKYDKLAKSLFRARLSISKDKSLRYSSSKNANCFRVLARILTFDLKTSRAPKMLTKQIQLTSYETIKYILINSLKRKLRLFYP